MKLSNATVLAISKIKLSNSNKNHRLKVVSIGGGSGQRSVLQALRTLEVDIVSVVSMFDSGGSTGILKREFNYLPLGDLRQCLVALAGEDKASKSLAETFQYRFPSESSLTGHALGNLVLSALIEQHSGLPDAIAEMSDLLKITGKVLPVTYELAELEAYLEDGERILGESKIDLRQTSLPNITKVGLDRQVSVNKEVQEAIDSANLIVIGPGDLYTSLIPNFLPQGMVNTIESAKGSLCYVSNIMTKRGETDGYTAERFVEALRQYMGKRQLNHILLNTTVPGDEMLQRYAEEGAEFVTEGNLAQQSGLEVVRGNYMLETTASSKVRHSPPHLAEAFKSILAQRR